MRRDSGYFICWERDSHKSPKMSEKPAFQHFHGSADFQPIHVEIAELPGVRAQAHVPTPAAAAKSALAGRGEQGPAEPERRARVMETSPAQPGLPRGRLGATVRREGSRLEIRCATQRLERHKRH